MLAANAAKEKEYALALEKYEKDFELYLQKVKQLQEDAEREWEKLLEKHNIIKIEAQEQHKNKIKIAEQDVQQSNTFETNSITFMIEDSDDEEE